MAFLLTHGQILQFLAGLAKTGRRGVVLDMSVLQVVQPFLQRSLGDLVELIDTNDIVFGEYLLRGLHLDSVLLLSAHAQCILGMNTDKGIGAMIQIVATLAEVEVNDADAVHFLHSTILLAQRHVLSDGLCHAVQDALQIVELTRQLDLDDDNLATVVLGLDIDAVELIFLRLLITLALKNLVDVYRLAYQHRDKPLQYTEVGLVTEHALDNPVKTYIFVCDIHNSPYILYSILQNYFSSTVARRFHSAGFRVSTPPTATTSMRSRLTPRRASSSATA